MSAPTFLRSSVRRAGAGAGFWMVAFAFTAAMAFTTVPTPLYAIYAVRDDFAELAITVIYAAYAVGVAAALYFAGPVSDWVGRRRVLLTGIALELLSGVLFLIWRGLPGLVVARLLCGAAIGLITATATAQLTELHHRARPGTGNARSDLVATAANLGGLSLGTLGAGLLAEWVAHPLDVPYLVFEAVLLLAVLAVALAPETVARPAERPPYRPQRIAIPAAGRARYLAVAAAGAAGFATFGLLNSLAPTFLEGTLHHDSRALAGVVTFAVFAAAAVAQMLLPALSTRRQLGLGFALMTLGLLALVAAVWLPSLAVFVLGSVVSGGGVGVLFRGATAAVIELAPPAVRGEALAGLFLAAYAGMTVPVIGLGLATQELDDRVALVGFTVLILASIAAAARLLLRRVRAPA